MAFGTIWFVFGILVLAIFITAIFVEIFIDKLNQPIIPVVALWIEALGIVVCLAGIGLYVMAEKQVEYKLFIPISTIDGAQYVQYDDPDSGCPVLINVNEMFSRKFLPGELIEVTVFSEGPYNGVYKRPNEHVRIADPSEFHDPTPPPCSGDEKCDYRDKRRSGAPA
jgi:hypothetical protein